MTRISSAMIPAASLADLSRAQQALVEAARESSAQTKATDLKGYGRQAQTLVSAQRMVARTNEFISTSSELKTRMNIQDVALGRASNAIQKLRDGLTQNIGLQSGDEVKASLDEAFGVIRDAMNTTLGGRYVFGGVANDQQPVPASTLSQLASQPLATSLPPAAGQQTVRIEESRTTSTGVVAGNVVDDALASIRTLASFDAGANGPFTKTLTQAQKDAITNELPNLQKAFDKIVSAQAENGRLLSGVESSTDRQQKQLDTLNQATGDITSVDLAAVAVKLNQAQFSYQASASIFATIKGLSLLNVLPPN